MTSSLLVHLAVVLSTSISQHDLTSYVVSQFENHRVVALGENHGHHEFHDALARLLEDPAAQRVVDDVVVEWGNSLYQSVADRYVRGEDVPWDSVTMIWRNTVVSPNTVWDAPMYEAFFRRLRGINATLQPHDRYRVLLADSPVDWADVHTADDLRPFYDRALAMAEVVRQESLLKGRRSLFVAGGLHVSRIPRVRVDRLGIPVGEITPVAWLELRHPGVTHVIQSLARIPDAGRLLSATGPDGGPAVLTTADAEVGQVPANRLSTLRNADGSRPDVYGAAVLADVVDAVLVWSDAQRNFEEPPSSLYRDDAYWSELNRRSLLLTGRPMDPELRGSDPGRGDFR
jgi:hypothetical protein